MAMFKVFVGNLDFKVTAEMLKPMFEAFGELDEVILAKDEEGKSRGFAIVLFKDAMKGQLAIETLADRKILGRSIVINEALKKGKKKMGPADVPAPRGPFGPKFREGGAAGARGGFGGRTSSRPGGFSSRPTSSLRGSTGSPGGAGPSSDRRGTGGSSRNPRRSLGGGAPRPPSPPSSGPGRGPGPASGGQNKPASDDPSPSE